MDGMENSELGRVGDPVYGKGGLGQMGAIQNVYILVNILPELNNILLLFRFSCTG